MKKIGRALLWGTVLWAFGVQAQETSVDPDIAPLVEVYLSDGSEILAAPDHRTVYVFDVDTTSASQCYDSCETHWPPVLQPAGSALGADVGTAPRKDGRLQLTYKGRPLYYFAGDKVEGDIRGDGLGKVWHIIHPD